MKIHVFYSGWLQTRIGRPDERLTVPDRVHDVAGLIGWLAGRSGSHADAFAHRDGIRAGVNGEWPVELSHAIRDGEYVTLVRGDKFPIYRVYYMASAEVFARFGLPGGEVPNLEELPVTHRFVCELKAPNKSAVMQHMQAEIWNANGEARSLIKNKGLNHTSMSIGDVIEDETGETFAVVVLGFKSLGRRNMRLIWPRWQRQDTGHYRHGPLWIVGAGRDWRWAIDGTPHFGTDTSLRDAKIAAQECWDSLQQKAKES